MSVMIVLTGCGTIPSSGPSVRAVVNAKDLREDLPGIQIVDVTESFTRSLIASGRADAFATALGDGAPIGSAISRGDVLDVAVWEAPPAVLFGAGGGDPRATSSGSTARGTTLPQQMVDTDGTITVPFVGRVTAAGRSPRQIEAEIIRRLHGKAHDPQVIVRLAENLTSTVTVVGDVTKSARVPLTAKGEKLLDILASVGGVRQPVDKMTIQITRGDLVATMALAAVIEDPRQNIRLQRDDVVTALFQPFSFVAMGATGTNAEVPFESTGISLSQALGRVAGLQDQRANAGGVFIFRFEEPGALATVAESNLHPTANGKIPVIYRVNLRDPKAFFVAQDFPIRNKDIVYVANAPMAEFQKFLNIVSSVVVPVVTVKTATQ